MERVRYYPATYGDILRTYADSVRKGYSDTDLTPRQRRMAAVTINTAVNVSECSHIPYPPTDTDRQNVARALADATWNGNLPALMDTIGGTALSDWSTAYERALEAVRNV